LQAQNIDASVIELNPGSLTDKFVAFLKVQRFAVDEGPSSITAACPNWGKLGRVALKYSRIVPSLDFMCVFFHLFLSCAIVHCTPLNL
jgi:hypothetical protein